MKTVDPQLLAEHNTMVDQFAGQVDALLTRHNVNEEQKKEYLKTLASLKEYFVETFGN